MGGIQIDSHSVVSYISQTLGMGSGNDFGTFHLLFLVWRGEKVLGWQAPSCRAGWVWAQMANSFNGPAGVKWYIT